ncbi:hypothetical protein [Kribbella sp. NPDC051620]|uniref:hypothetical protein n=1 Tax=Kribbella sp. NPDC051620 TaxID=3364120 RepID=UPI00378F8BC2
MGIFSRKQAPAQVSTDGLLLDRGWADPELDAAFEAVRKGDLAVGLELLKATEPNTDQRSIRVGGLGEAATGRSEQLELFLEAAPGDPDLLLWLGRVLVSEAWEVRSGKRAKEVSDQQFATFHDILATAGAVVNTAIDQAPDDASPWDVLQWIALGLQASPEDKDHIFRSACERQPDSYAAHSGRVQVLAPKWSGRDIAELVRFGDETVSKAKPGAVLNSVLGMVAAEVWIDVLSDSELTKLQRGARYTREITNRKDALLAASAKWLIPGRAPQAADISGHGTMAFALMKAGAKQAAMDHATLTQGRIESLPWGYSGGDDPLMTYATAVAKQMA